MTFKSEIPPRRLFEATTIAELAEVVRGYEAAPGQAEKLARLYLRVRSLSAEEAERMLAAGGGR